MADPGRFQLVFTALYVIDVGVRVAFGSWFGLICGPGLALMAAPLLARGRPRRAVGPARPPAGAGPAVADIAIIGVSRLAPEGGNGLLGVFPALWLGRQWGRLGAVVAGARDRALPGGARGDLHRRRPAPARRARSSSRSSWSSRRSRSPTGWSRSGCRPARSSTSAGSARRSSTPSTSGLLLLDRDGQYVGMNRRHQEFMALGYPDGHDGRAGQLGEVFDVDGRTPMPRERMPAVPRQRGGGVRRRPDVDRRRPGDAAGAVGLGAHGARRGRRLRRRRARPTTTSPTSCGRCR